VLLDHEAHFDASSDIVALQRCHFQFDRAGKLHKVRQFRMFLCQQH